ncbi:unnamed protein product [Adineta ricciae]|uniref:Alpha-tubulin N-acetyltransferase n=1 Tax=Adineta ricciae TaxID=249248 RepID=A0A813ZZS1_ADIRI|nr:unnamed protein product [Adineta ricciae]
MEFPFDINAVLPQEITILNGDFRVLNHGQTARISASERLTTIIDTLGEASYKAQSLPCPVTTARKFRISDHRLYLIKNVHDHNNLGSVVGLLKVGAKHLYVYDSHGQVHERTPLCLLDFYVHESKQRSGYGKKLFEAMLEFEKCNAYELAIDRPSNKCLGFLQKHYQLLAPIHQVNNFVVYNAFFNRPFNLPSRKSSASRRVHDNSVPVDNFRRPELTSWLLPSEKQQANRRPYSEQIDGYAGNRVQKLSDEGELDHSRRQAAAISASSVNNERKLLSAYPATHTYPHNEKPSLNEPIRTNVTSHSASHNSRRYPNLFNENNPFPSLQRYNTNAGISTNKQLPPQTYTYKDYQSSTINNSRPNLLAPSSQPPPLTSLYTFPSLLKPTNHWRRSPQQQQQSSTIDASSSGWRVFGVHRLPD